MARYEIRKSEEFSKIYPEETRYIIVNNDLPRRPVFAGYNFMGGAEWDDDVLCAYFMDLEEADQIVADLKAEE